MTITWFGQSCFRIEAKEGSVLIDPFAKSIGLKPPKPNDDIVLITHEHHDHNNREGITPEALVIDNPGEYERKGISVRGIRSYHDNTQGSERGLNTVYIIKAEELTVCHLGDLGQEQLSDTQVQEIGEVDLLLIPVGGTYTVDGKEAARITAQIEPKMIIPMHFKIPGLSIELEGVEKFIKEIGLTPEKSDKLKVAKKTLPMEETKLVVLTA